MAENYVSPEEKLLKLIRTPKKSPAEAIKKTLELPVLREETKQSYPAPSGALSRSEEFSLPLLRRVVMAFFIVSCVYLIFSLFLPLFKLDDHKKTILKEDGIDEIKPEAENKIKPYEFYAQAINSRKVFSSSSVSQEKPVSNVIKESADLIKDISLVGIITGENTQAVLEDKKAQKTYYLSRGQALGELLLEDIQEGKIILNYKGQRLELYL
ncbi:MAG: hypothetical protein JW788_04375 [Candidatus Omnitrophica bacterium]|nr:hypothetical protein [Candidatus Omnitrophota bacterium]